MRNLVFVLLAFVCSLATRAETALPASAVVPPAREFFHLYLLMGQSNMAGRDTRTLDQQVDDPRILSLNADGHWVIARDPLHPQQGRTVPGAGPGIPFARELVKTDPKIVVGLIPCAVGGTPLRRWTKGADLYEQALVRARQAAQAGILSGVLWHQGESDTTSQANAETYEARLARMLRDLRQDLGQPELPIVVGQIGDFLTAEKYPFADTVRGAIRHIPALVPRVGYADSAGLGHKGDQLHFSAEAQQELGARFARAMRGLQNDASAAPLPVTVFKSLQAGRKQTVVVYGTSLTIQGAWARSLADYFEKNFPGQVTFENSAKAGMHSDWGVANLRERVLDKKPDLVFLEFAVNDASTHNQVSLEKAGANLDAMVQALRGQNPQVDIVLQTMNLAWDSPRVPGKKYGSDRPDLAAYYDVYRRYAHDHGLPLVDNQPHWQALWDESREKYQDAVPDGIHPGDAASVAVTWPAIRTLLEQARQAAAAPAP